MTPLETDIHKTVAWFSLFETPVTVFELWRWMVSPARPYRLEEIYEALASSAWLSERLAGADGYWSLRGEALAPVRRERFLDAVRKYAKLRRATGYLSRIPTVESIAAGNTLAWWNTRAESDIDLYIVVRPGTVWVSRLLCVTPFALLGKRPGKASKDPFCFSFFRSADAPPISSFALEGSDPYLELWERSLVTIYTRSTTPNPSLKRRGNEWNQRGGWLSWLEVAAKRIQRRRLPARITDKMNRDTCVVVSDQVLKFHENDRRAEYRERWNHLCES